MHLTEKHFAKNPAPCNADTFNKIISLLDPVRRAETSTGVVFVCLVFFKLWEEKRFVEKVPWKFLI